VIEAFYWLRNNVAFINVLTYYIVL